MLAKLVGHGALCRQDAPVRAFGQMRARQHLFGLLELACVHQRAAIGPEDFEVIGVLQHGILQDRNGLCVLTQRAQGAGKAEGRCAVARIGFMARRPGLQFGPPLRLRDRRIATE